MTKGRARTSPGGSRKLGRPADTDSTDTRDRITECARERFAAEGFEGTTNKEIAELAGVSSAALYHYFPSKADLYVAVCESITKEFVDVFARVTSRAESLESRLVHLLHEIEVLGNDEPSTIGFITGISAVVRKHPEVSEGADAFGGEFRRLVILMISTATESEKILRGASVQGFADLTSAVLAGLGRLSVSGGQQRHLGAADAFKRLIK